MELVLTHQTKTQIEVICDDHPSHVFDLHTLLLKDEKELLDDPVAYGKKLFEALFPSNTTAQSALVKTLEVMPGKLLIVTTEDDLDAIPWEYTYGPEGFLVLVCHFVRGLPANQRVDPPVLDSGLHIVAIPSNPLDKHLSALNIDGEWIRLKEIIQEVPYAITLERTRPSTIEQLRNLVTNRHNRVVHFMGHGGQDAGQDAILCFEKENGALDRVKARQFVLRVRGNVFLVTLNACVSASPGVTAFSNLAASLVRQKTPYALGMRFSISDKDARTFSRIFYSDLARGSSIEEALFQARLTLANSSSNWVIGVPILYTALSVPANGFNCVPGIPSIQEHQPKEDVSILPRAEEAFQGRVKEMQRLGDYLTDDRRPRLITIHGSGGQGKTTLAREAVERFAYAWPGGVWAISLENLPSREMFVNDLARFLDIDTQNELDSTEVERLVTAQLAHRRTLVVLDNAETLVEAVEEDKKEAVQLAQFIREQLPNPSVSLLATSRSFLRWANEIVLQLDGLAPLEGVKLFEQYAPHRVGEIDRARLWELCEAVNGHPLSLRLLSSTFNASNISFPAFMKEYQTHLLGAENKYVDLDDRQRTLYASIETSVRFLDPDLRSLLSGLWVFHAPFLPEIAVTIFDPEHEDTEDNPSPIRHHIHTLWQRGLLTRQRVTTRDGLLTFYSTLPTLVPYIEYYMEQAFERDSLQVRFGDAFSMLVASLHGDLGHNASSVIIARYVSADLEQAKLWVTDIKRAYYLVHWGSILKWLGDRQGALALFEQALEIVQGQDRKAESEILEVLGEMYRGMGEPQHALELFEQALSIIDEMGERTREARILVSIAAAYQTMGQRQQALEIYEQALPIAREAGDRAREGHILNNMAEVYRATSQLPLALEYSEQALAITRELGYQAGEAVTLSNMALIHFDMGQPEQALEIFEQALPIAREVSDRPQEATILNNIAGVYSAKKQMPKALEMFEQILPIMRETHNRPGEAVVLNNMGMIYRNLGQLNRSLDLLKQSLAIRREVSDRAGEGNMLNNIAIVYNDIGQPERSLELFEQALPIVREVNDRLGEATALSSMALLLYQYFNRPKEAIAHLERSIAIMVEAGLTHNNADGRSIEEWRQFLEAMYRDVPLDDINSLQPMLPAADVQQIVTNTVVVMTLAPDQRPEWRQIMQENLKQIQQQGTKWHIEADFFAAILGVIDGQLPTLPDGHPYASALAAIYEGIAGGRPQIVDLPDALMQAVREFVYTEDWKIGRQVMEAQQALFFQPEVELFFEQMIALAKFGGDQDTADLFEEHLVILRECKRIGIEGAFEKFKKRDEEKLPFDIKSVAPIVDVLLGGSAEEKMQYQQHLATQAEQAKDEELKALIRTMQLALFGGDLMQLGQDLKGVYREVWEAVVTMIETDGFGPNFFQLIVRETTEVLSSNPDYLNGWRETLTQMKDQAREGTPTEFVLLVDAIIGLLDANGNPTGLGMQLTGIYEQTWQEILDRLA